MNDSRLTLEFKPDLAEATQRWLAFWEHELLDRPPCVITAPREGAQPVGLPPYLAGAREDFGPVVARVLEHCAAVWWGGEAVPNYVPAFGPDQFAAWLGGELVFPEEDTGTDWVKPCVEDWDSFLPLRLEEDNYWWRRMREFCAALAQGFRGKLIVGHLDLHSNMDALLALRGGMRLSMDLLDQPEAIDRAMQQVRALYRPVYKALYQAGGMAQTGTCGWVTAYHPVRTNTIQCDYAALIGPEHFRRWALPALEEEAAFLGHCVYHLDGPECLVHLEDLCAIPGLDCIQWTVGARNKPFREWVDLLQRIQALGTAVWVPCTAEEIPYYHRQLRPELVYYECAAPSQAEGERALAWLAENT